MADTVLNNHAQEFYPGRQDHVARQETSENHFLSYIRDDDYVPEDYFNDYPCFNEHEFPSTSDLAQHYDEIKDISSSPQIVPLPSPRRSPPGLSRSPKLSGQTVSPKSTPVINVQKPLGAIPDKVPRKPVEKRRTPPAHPERTSPVRKISPQPKAMPSNQSYDEQNIVNLIRSQLEFYFSDKNLLEELNSNLIFYMKQRDMWVPFYVVMQLPKVRSLQGSKAQCLQALRTSALLELDATETKVRRPDYAFPREYKVRKSLRRSVFVYGLSKNMTEEELRGILQVYGNILSVAFPTHTEGPDEEMGRIIMKKKLGESTDLTNLTSVFVVFESQSQANKCVKSRSRSAIDGIRTIHKYDYNKVVKRLGKGMSPNASPLFAPSSTCSPSITSERGSPSSASLSGVTPTLRGGTASAFKLSPAMHGHRSPSFKARSMSRSPIVRGHRSPHNGPSRSPGLRARSSPGWKLDAENVRPRSSSQNVRVVVAKGPDSSKGFRWPRNPAWKKVVQDKKGRTAFDVLGESLV